jgi:hypothetical protein
MLTFRSESSRVTLGGIRPPSASRRVRTSVMFAASSFVRRVRNRRSTRWTVIGAVGIVALAGIVVPLAASPAGPAGGWTIVNTPSTNDGGNDLLLGATCANAQECWAVGVDLFNLNGGNTVAYPIIQQWDGTGWSLVAAPPGQSGLFGATCVSSSDCWAVGATLSGGQPSAPVADHWNGSSWTAVPAPNVPGAGGALLHSVSCVSTDDCWAVGSTTDGNGNALGTIMLQWNGVAWSLGTPASTGQPYQQLNSVDCSTGDDCWAVGATGPEQQSPNFLPIFPGAVGDQGLIEHFDGTQWTIVPSYSAASPNGGWVSSIDCVTDDDCWAVGSTTDTSGGPSGNLVQHWDGSSWSVEPAPAPSGSPGVLTGVVCLSSSRCWASGAVGQFGQSGGGGNLQPAPEIEAWNGSNWSPEESPNVTALALLANIACVSADGCWSVGTSVTDVNGDSPDFASLVEQLVFPPASSQGFVAASSDGGVYNFGTFPFLGSMGGTRLARPVIGIAATPDDDGYWEVASDGGIFSFGHGSFYGSMGGRPLNQPVVGMASTPDGRGYWEVASDGGIFSFGDANFYGSMGGTRLNEPIVGMAAAPDGQGYWEVARDGGIFAFGSARFYGSMGGAPLSKPVVGMVATPNGRGYWEVGADGGVFGFGNAAFYGSVPAQGIRATVPITAMAATPDGGGYWLLGADGSTYTYGDATFLGSLAGVRLAAPVVGASP